MSLLATFTAMKYAPTWSTLRTLGQSRIVSLTVFVPFLVNLAQYLYPIKQWATEVSHGADTDSFRWTFTINRLYCAYIGLTLLGVASFVFIILCPPIIKRYSTFEGYVDIQQPIITTPRLWIIQQDNAQNYMTNAVPSLTPTYPMSLAVLFETHLRTAFRSIASDTYDPSQLVSATDEPIYDAIAEKIAAGRRVDRGFSKQCKAKLVRTS